VVSYGEHSNEYYDSMVALGGLVVIVLAIGPKVRVFKPGRAPWIFNGYKIRSTTSFGWEVKPSVPCRTILRKTTFCNARLSRPTQ
jgi:hypothetical protein